MEAWNDQVDAHVRLDQLLKKISRAKSRVQPFDPEDAGELRAYMALRFEQFGDKLTAMEEWKKLEQDALNIERKLVLVAQDQLQKLGDQLGKTIPGFDLDKGIGLIKARADRLALVQQRLDEVDKLEKGDQEEKAAQLLKEIKSLYRHVDDKDLKKLLNNKKKEEDKESNKENDKPKD
jgi:hypothetical protein